jgi:hypothetical protein
MDGFHILYIFVCFPSMRQAIAISLILTQLFILGGYKLMLRSFEWRADRRMEARIDASRFEESELREIRVPVNLPYHSDWADFEPYSGTVEIGGVHYNYVKRRLVKDTMVLLVLPNTDRTRITHARETFYTLVNDLGLSDEGKESIPPQKSVKPFQSEYPVLHAIRLPEAPMGEIVGHKALSDGRAVECWRAVPHQPPECRA